MKIFMDVHMSAVTDMLSDVRHGPAMFDPAPPRSSAALLPLGFYVFEVDGWATPRNAQSDFRVDYKGMDWMDYTSFGEQLL